MFYDLLRFVWRTAVSNCEYDAFRRNSDIENTEVIIESLSFALYVKRQTPGKEKFYGIRQ
jgi:hypothetical protein